MAAGRSIEATRVLTSAMTATNVLDRVYASEQLPSDAARQARIDAWRNAIKNMLDFFYQKSAECDSSSPAAVRQGGAERSLAWLSAMDEAGAAGWLLKALTSLAGNAAVACDLSPGPLQRPRPMPSAASLTCLTAAVAKPGSAQRAFRAEAEHLGLNPLRSAAESCARLTQCGSQYAKFFAQLGTAHVRAATATGDAPPSVDWQLPAPARQLLGALAGSGLLPALAEAVLQCPAPETPAAERAGRGRGTAGQTRAGTTQDDDPLESARVKCIAAGALELSLAVRCCVEAEQTLTARGAEVDVSSALAAQLADPRVTALGLALLDRLAVHSGLEPEGVGAAGGGWWLPRLEAGAGRVLGMAVETESDGDLEIMHCHWLHASLQAWRSSEDGTTLRPPPAAPGMPSPVELARLAARAAEAVCRMYRGQGLRGAYTRPEWLLTGIPPSIAALSPCPEDVAPETVPLWLEASAWALALSVEAVAAGLEGRGGPEEGDEGVEPLTIAAAGYRFTLERMDVFTLDRLQRLSPAARADAVSRLRRAGLAASLDYALRLSCLVADRAAASNGEPAVAGRVAAELRRAVASYARVLHGLPFACVPPAAAEAPAPGPGCWPQAAAPDCGNASGLLMTLGKRGIVLATRLEALEHSQGPPAEQQRAALLEEAHALLPSLSEGVDMLSKQLAALQGGGGGARPGAEAALAKDALSFLLRAGARLAAVAAAGLAHEAPPAAAHEGPATTVPWSRQNFFRALPRQLQSLREAALGLDRLGGGAGRLLACQPHRLLAATCKLLASPQPGPREDVSDLVAGIPGVLAALGASAELSGRVRWWLLAPSETAPGATAPAGEETEEGRCKAAAVNGAAAGAEAGAPPVPAEERGCLEGPLRACLVPLARQLSRPHAGCVLALLHTAQHASSEDCLETARALSAWLKAGTVTALLPALPDGTPVLDLVAQHAQQPSDAGALAVEAAALLQAPLPLALTPPPEALALPRLRVCGFPGCGSFGGACEAALPPMQCGGPATHAVRRLSPRALLLR
ncbi:hypothetical protein HYH03_005300 [Edaphochlamys debaryana]|uniref:Uncharacterized protein n=1 Tax=Edaphochlamys debaryana TaxID=47281 RepID=A0A835YF53_9CHLO|nr:hypothetical protein HYH03_005300 [Edaphochlamys debaryana]|eukprot:KAG2496474.1 hypothetical protein HYH03_005300 [Edaphochlamys debaryana]